MAKSRNTKIMIYVAHSETSSKPAAGNTSDERLTDASAQLKSCMDPHPLAHAGCRNRSLVFGPCVVRKSQSDLHLCKRGETAVRHVNRLWYGRALVALRTYPQWSMRSAAVQQRAHSHIEGDGEDCSNAIGNPVQ